MDGYQANASNTGGHQHQYQSGLPGISPQQLQHNIQPHTLPPLQNAPVSLYGSSAPQTPRTPSTPAPNMYAQMGGQASSRGYQMPQNMREMQSNPYQQQHQQYPTATSMLPQSMSSLSHPQPIAPAPTQGRLPPPLRPMPAVGVQMQPGMSNPYGHQQMLSQPSMMPEPEQLTHVVGSQGRRGILPSAPGRPAVTNTGTGSTKNTMIPAKDADGKFPCPHCTKTYLHAKHLKRHLLRHTGDRPYMCPLCRDTFSRSDILKRHFQKCSIRRGNPTGASHLSHAQAHLKKSHPGPHKGSSGSTDGDLSSNISGINGLSTDTMLHPFGISPDGRIPDAVSNLTGDQANQQMSRSNSQKRLGEGAGIMRRNVAGPRTGNLSRAGFDQNYNEETHGPMHPSTNNQLTAFGLSNGQNGNSFNQNYDFNSHGNQNLPSQGEDDISAAPASRTAIPMFSGGQVSQSGVDWSQMFHAGTSDNFMASFNPNLASQHMPLKTEAGVHQANDGLFTGMYPNSIGPDRLMGFPNWDTSPSHIEPFQRVSSLVISFCFPPGSPITAQSNSIRSCLTPDSIKHFLEQYTNFQGHFPMIHMPTFRIDDTYQGLILSMICIGAVYSEMINPSLVRDLMEMSKVVVERDSRVFGTIRGNNNSDLHIKAEAVGATKADLEEMQAILLLHILFTWHGTPVQRENARRNFPMLITLVRQCGLTQPTKPPQSFSVLHQPHVNTDKFNIADFDWKAWIEQETRSRLVCTISLVDNAMTLFFNQNPQFENLEVRVPLPADDAAWDARTSQACAEALGLHGAIAARDRNPEGSRRTKQPELHSAMKALMNSSVDLVPSSTNLYSKFIIIHALHVQVWTVQRQITQEANQMTSHVMAFPSSGSSTPLTQHDWITSRKDTNSSGTTSTNTSGRATPVESSGQQSSQQMVMIIDNALDKWKRAWDEDMMLQYPPNSSNMRRFGFIRDGQHFFWLAKYLLKNRALDWQLAPDQRMAHIMYLLKYVRNWVVTDSAKRGEELGSISDVDRDFAVSDLTLDMAQLFRPIPQPLTGLDSGAHTNIPGDLG